MISIVRAHDVSEPIQVGRSEKVVIAIASLNILIDPVQIKAVCLEQFHLLSPPTPKKNTRLILLRINDEIADE